MNGYVFARIQKKQKTKQKRKNKTKIKKKNLSRFSFTKIHNSRDSRGRGIPSL